MPENSEGAAAEAVAETGSGSLSADASAARTAAAEQWVRDDADIEETLDATVRAGEAAPKRQDPKVKSGYDPDRYQEFENLKSILELVLGPIVALVSAATGFYFGAQQAGKARQG
jgi:hypothetical protein